MNRNKVKQSIFSFLIKNGVQIDYDVYSYGYSAFVGYLAYAAIMIPIAVLLEILVEVITFLIFFIPLRRYIGGYHFDSKVLCLMFSILFSIIISYTAVWCGQISIFLRITMFLMVIIITLLVKAVDHSNKRISNKEKKIYTRKALFIEILYFLIILSVYNLNTYPYLNIALFSVVFCALGILIGKLKMLKC